MQYPTPTRIDLHGKRCDEAIESLEASLDASDQRRITVVHGDGTGNLRNAVRKYLATRRDVKKFEPEGVNLTGDGVTVVYRETH